MEKYIGYIKCCLKYRKTFLKWGIVGCIAGFVFALGIPKIYTAESILAPESTRKTTSSSLSSLASMAGINLNATTTSDAINFNTYPAILKSNPFVYDLFKTQLKFKYKDDSVTTTVYDYMENYRSKSWWSFPLRIPKLVVSLFKEKKIDTLSDPINFTAKQDILAKNLRKGISISVDKKTQIMTITTRFQNAAVSAQICNAVVDLLKKYIIKYRTEKARNNEEYFEDLFKEKQREYYAAQQAYANYADANQNVARKSNLIEEERLKNEVQFRYNIYTSCSKELENAKAAVQQETPVFAIVKPAAVPIMKSSPSKMKYAIGFGILAIIATAFWVLVLKEKKIELV